jgi:gamma-butyrobetaine dioxygenase
MLKVHTHDTTESAPLVDQLADLHIGQDLVTVTWADGAESGFHGVWLRDNCATGLHPSTRERQWDWAEVDPDIRPLSGRIDNAGLLELSWPDGHLSRHDGAWLRRHRYDEAGKAERKPQLRMWDATIAEDLPNCDANAVLSDDTALLDMLIKVRDTGFALLRGMPHRDKACEDVAHRIAFTRETNFGIGFDVISKPDPNNQAYTHDALLGHTDLSNREMPPGVQFLHCLEFQAQGGESTLIDGFHCAEQLRATAPDAFDLLTRVPIAHRFHDGEWDVRWRAPSIALDQDGEYHEIRYNPGIGAPFDVRPEEMKPLYRALGLFAARIKDPENLLAFKLRPGDMMVFNNRRVLHGRQAFDPSSGPRRLQGCYVDLDEWHSRIRVLTGENLLD